MSLVALAEKGDLPEHQFMDADTLGWIKWNNPGFDRPLLDQKRKERILGVVEKYLPKKEWFKEPKIVDSIHGIRHIMRETANVANLLYSVEMNDVSKSEIYLASCLHDIRRINDKGDEGHAVRAAEWIKSNIKEIQSHFNIKLSEDDLKKITVAITLHELPYEQIRNSDEYTNNKLITDYVKTADAMDRFRLPKLKWWLNTELLELIPDRETITFAYWLVVDSETEFLKSTKSDYSVMSSLNNWPVK